MPIVKFDYDPASPPPLTADEIAMLEASDALTDEEITARAESDPDNPPLTDDELMRFRGVRLVRDARARSGLSQAAFAEAYHFTLGRLRDLEQGRTRPDSAVLAYLSLIADDPVGVRKRLARDAA